jgi:hypothetical protein
MDAKINVSMSGSEYVDYLRARRELRSKFSPDLKSFLFAALSWWGSALVVGLAGLFLYEHLFPKVYPDPQMFLFFGVPLQVMIPSIFGVLLGFGFVIHGWALVRR